MLILINQCECNFYLKSGDVMRLVSVDNLKPELLLARSIFDSFGRVLLRKGTSLTVSYIQRLKDLHYKSVYVDDGIPESFIIDDVVSEGIRAEAVKVTKESLLNVKAGKSFQERKIKQIVNDLIDEIISNREIIVHLVDIRSLEEDTFSHAVNVCILSVMTGLAMGYNQLRLKELGIGALLHDVGKAAMLDEANNPNKITREVHQMLQKHCDFGFEVLRKSDNIGIIAAHVAWQHHECYNGSGYPRKLAGKGIQEFARIVAIANEYDKLTTDKLNRERYLPHEAIEMIRSKQGLDFDPDIVAQFIPNISPYPTGGLVLLNTGFKGNVVSVNKKNPSRPKVKLICDNKGQKIEGIHIVDLIKESSLYITEILRELN